VNNCVDPTHTMLTGQLALCTCDMDAKAKFQNFGGSGCYYGCFYCLIHGKYIKQKHHIYFPGPVAELRSSQYLQFHADNEMYSVKSLPALYRLQEVYGKDSFDCIFGVISDAMHQIFMGVTEKNTNWWLDKGDPFLDKSSIPSMEKMLRDLNSGLLEEMT
jgi:hypothetical protein